MKEKELLGPVEYLPEAGCQESVEAQVCVAGDMLQENPAGKRWCGEGGSGLTQEDMPGCCDSGKGARGFAAIVLQVVKVTACGLRLDWEGRE